MIVKYAGNLYKGKRVSGEEKMVEITTNSYVEGFVEKRTLTGRVIYKRDILMDESEEIYDLNFYVQYGGSEFSAAYYDGKIILCDNGRKCAVELGFLEKERNMWMKEIALTEVEKFIILKYDYKKCEEEKVAVNENYFLEQLIIKNTY